MPVENEEIEDRRVGCKACFKSQFDNMVGAQSVNKWLLRAVVIIIVLNGGYTATVGADQATRIALLENAVVELKDMSKQNIKDHDQMKRDQQKQTAVIVQAVTKAIEDTVK